MSGSDNRTDIAKTFANRVAVFVIGALISVILARSLGPTGRGEYAVAVTFASTAAAFGHLSLEQALVGSWADPTRRSTTAGAAIQVGVIVGPIAAVVGTLIAPLVVGSGELRLAQLATLAVAPTIVVLYLNAIAVADGRVQLVNRTRLLAAAFQLLVVTSLLVASAVSVPLVVVISIAVPVVHLCLIWLGRTWQSEMRSSASIELVTVGLRYHLGNVATQLLRRVDVLILARFEDQFEVGLYALAVTIAELLYLVSDSVAQVTQPSQLAASPEVAVRRTGQLVRVTVLVAAASAAGLAATAWMLVPLAYGNDFGGAVPGLLLLIPGVILLAALRPLSILLLRQYRPWLVTAANILALVVNVALNLALITTIGLNGAALASTVAYAVQFLLYCRLARRLTGLTGRELVPTLADVRRVRGSRK